LSIFRNFVEKIQILLHMTRIAGTLHEDLCTFMIISRAILLTVRNVSDKYFRENHNTQSIFNIFFPRKSCLYEIMWKNTVEPGRPQHNTEHAHGMPDN
jgi:hypothetical protein